MSFSRSSCCICGIFLAASVALVVSSNIHRQGFEIESWRPATAHLSSLLGRTVTDCGDGINYCQNNGNCTTDPSTGAFLECNCTGTSFIGQFCQCEDTGVPDPCETLSCGSSPAAGSCVWNCGMATCSCNQGFTLSGGTCVNVNECALNPQICDAIPNTECVDEEGSYKCDCNLGFDEVDGVCQRLCPFGSGWRPHGDSCYFSPSPRLTPAEARDICHGYGSDLICEVKDEDELTFIGLFAQGTTWLGYTDNDHEGTYTCTYDDGDSFDEPSGNPPLEWQNLEPNGLGSENCVTLVHNQWASVDCNEQHNFICELMDPMEDPCPDGWTAFTHNGATSCYWNPPGKASFFLASEFCKLAVPESDLMIINTERENDVVASWYGFLQASGPTYIGYRKEPNDNDWMWTGQGAPSLFENWLPNMPTNAPGVQECAVLVPSKMMDVACTVQNNFICKSDVEHELPLMGRGQI